MSGVKKEEIRGRIAEVNNSKEDLVLTSTLTSFEQQDSEPGILGESAGQD